MKEMEKTAAETEQEILQNVFKARGYFGALPLDKEEMDCIYHAMKLFSRQREQQEAVTFAEFIVQSTWSKFEGDHWCKWEDGDWGKRHSAAELYNSPEFKSWQDKENRK